MQWSFQDFQETHMYIKTKDVHNCSSTDLSSSLQNALETKKKATVHLPKVAVQFVQAI